MSQTCLWACCAPQAAEVQGLCCRKTKGQEVARLQRINCWDREEQSEGGIKKTVAGFLSYFIAYNPKAWWYRLLKTTRDIFTNMWTKNNQWSILATLDFVDSTLGEEKKKRLSKHKEIADQPPGRTWALFFVKAGIWWLTVYSFSSSSFPFRLWGIRDWAQTGSERYPSPLWMIIFVNNDYCFYVIFAW